MIIAELLVNLDSMIQSFNIYQFEVLNDHIIPDLKMVIVNKDLQMAKTLNNLVQCKADVVYQLSVTLFKYQIMLLKLYMT